MKVNLPENIEDITLDQFNRYMDLIDRDLDVMNFNKRKVSIFTNISFKDLANIKAIDFERISKQIDIALDTPAQFKPKFKLNGKEFGFIPKLDNITAGEFADIEKYQSDKKDLHKVMAVLFRPIKEKVNDRYSIENYKGTEEYSETMKQMPLNIVNGSLVFFLNLANELENCTQKFLSVE